MAHSDLDSLLQDLQLRYAFQEDHISSLNETVVEQGRRLDQLERRCQHLQQLLQDMAEGVEQARQPTSERPPHY